MIKVQEERECPLCLEQLDAYEVSFFPCKCGYQICQFCWNRIKEDENNLCPACRHPYTDAPADSKQISSDEWKKIMMEKKKREQRKVKIPESRKHLANFRVVQKNLVLIHGVPVKLSDPELLKKAEYFGQFGKIHKVVVGHNNNVVQSSAVSVYVTYYKEEDAIKAILSLNQRHLDGRTLKASLGTTKYCSLFLHNKVCLKQDCMYLHEVADAEASFTKEDMAAKKHEEYERRVCEEIISKRSSGQTQNNSLQNNTEVIPPSEQLQSVENDKVNSVQRPNSATKGVPTKERKSEIINVTPPGQSLNRRRISLPFRSINLYPYNNNNSNVVTNATTKGWQQTESTFTALQLHVSENSLFSNDESAYLRPKMGRITEYNNNSYDNINNKGEPLINNNNNINSTLHLQDTSNFAHKEKEIVKNDSTQGFRTKDDDDLDFDPYIESSKGLEDLVREEKEQLQRHRNYLQQLQQVSRHIWSRTDFSGLNTTDSTSQPTSPFLGLQNDWPATANVWNSTTTGATNGRDQMCLRL